jgi:hypothetical protein
LANSAASTTVNDLLTARQEVSSSPIISHSDVSLASKCITNASTTRVHLIDSPASPDASYTGQDATNVQPIVSQSSLNPVSTTSTVTVSSCGTGADFVISMPSDDVPRPDVILPSCQDSALPSVFHPSATTPNAAKCSPSVSSHSEEISPASSCITRLAKPEPRKGKAKTSQCNPGEIAKITVISKTLRLAMEFDSTESDIANNLVKLQPTAAIIAAAFTQAGSLL